MEQALFYWAFIQSFLFGGTILVYRNNIPNRILATFFFLVSILILFQFLLLYHYWLFDYPATLFFPDIINMCIGPVFYMYSRQLVYKEWKNSNLLHIIPPVLLTVYFIVFEIIPESDFYYLDYINTVPHIVVLTLILVSNLVYILLFLSNFKKCGNLYPEKFKMVKQWMSFLLIFFIIQFFINFVMWFFHFGLQQSNEQLIQNAQNFKTLIFIVLNAIIIFTTGFFIIANTEVITSLGVKISKRLKSKSFEIDKKDAAKHIARLEKLMAEEKIYLDSQLNEKKLAEKLELQSYYLSKLMNNHMKSSFNEYINKARIEETKRLLESDKARDLTLYAIAVDSGFSSESVFYSNFKKYVGMTPNQYKKQFLKKK
jgi:AraC-like DNA-binding protein